MHVCNLCNFKSKRKYDLDRHFQTIKHKQKNNTKKRKYICCHCYKIFTRSDSLKRHVDIFCKLKSSKNVPLLKIICPFCNKKFSRIDSRNRHIREYCQYIESPINYNNIFNINSIEETDTIKSFLNYKKLINICSPERIGCSKQLYDIVVKIQDFSLKLKRNVKELRNFRKTNKRDNIIDIFENNEFIKKFFDEYNRNDLYKITNFIIDKCNNQLYEQRLQIICNVIKNYKYYITMNEEYRTGYVIYVLNALEDCEKISKVEHYNITIL